MKISKILFFLFLTICALGVISCSSSGSSKKRKGVLNKSDLNALQEDRFGSGSIPLAEGSGVFRDIHFAYDSSEISDIARQDIEYNVEILKANPDINVLLEGHCDERGTAEYNMALGADRSLAADRVLKSYGISPSRIKTISYGEELPLDPGHNEKAYALNRRVHFAPYRK